MTGSPIEPTDPAFAEALWSLHCALDPVQRTAAMFLALAQRNLATALASSPAQIACDPDMTDPETDYREWVVWMTEAEEHHRAAALRSAEAGRRRRPGRGKNDEPIDPATEAVYRASLDRAISAIEAMTSNDASAATAAHQDLDRWEVADLDAEIAFLTTYGKRRT